MTELEMLENIKKHLIELFDTLIGNRMLLDVHTGNSFINRQLSLVNEEISLRRDMLIDDIVCSINRLQALIDSRIKKD